MVATDVNNVKNMASIPGGQILAYNTAVPNSNISMVILVIMVSSPANRKSGIPISIFTRNTNNNDKYGIAEAINVHTANRDRNENLLALRDCNVMITTDTRKANDDTICKYPILFESNPK